MKIYSIFLVLFLIPTVTLGQNKDIIGVYEGVDTASMSIYDKLTITKDYISWPQTNNLRKCSTKYKVISRSEAMTYPNQMFNRDAPDGFIIIKIELESNDCVGNLKYLQFAFLKHFPSSVRVVEYDKANKAIGDIHFYKGE